VHRDAHCESGHAFHLEASAQKLERGLHLDSSYRGLPRVFRIARWCAEHSEDSVSDEVLDHALARQNHVDHRREIPVEKACHPAWSEPLGHRGESAKVGKENRHVDDLSIERVRLVWANTLVPVPTDGAAMTVATAALQKKRRPEFAA